jgi:hypothetical protein
VVVVIIALIIGVLTAGFGLVLVPIAIFIMNLIAVVCSIITINPHNQKIAREVVAGVNQ